MSEKILNSFKKKIGSDKIDDIMMNMIIEFNKIYKEKIHIYYGIDLGNLGYCNYSIIHRMSNEINDPMHLFSRMYREHLTYFGSCFTDLIKDNFLRR